MITILTHLLAFVVGYRLAGLDLFRPSMMPGPWPRTTRRTEQSEDQ